MTRSSWPRTRTSSPIRSALERIRCLSPAFVRAALNEFATLAPGAAAALSLALRITARLRDTRVLGHRRRVAHACASCLLAVGGPRDYLFARMPAKNKRARGQAARRARETEQLAAAAAVGDAAPMEEEAVPRSPRGAFARRMHASVGPRARCSQLAPARSTQADLYRAAWRPRGGLVALTETSSPSKTTTAIGIKAG